ncbi:MAG: hypothetical protein JST89_10920 [Cyanobacteria bacterium SZAS-4]|nr:hypothetical protein [Cyanobacteria bacterium SZAS-4]
MTDDKYRGGGSDPLSKRILNSIKPFSGEQTSKWLAALSTDAVKDSVVIKNDSDPNQEPPRSMAAWVDGLFDHFQRYAYDFSGMCNEPELQVSCTRPTLQEPKGPGPDTSVISLGYLSTHQWALVVRGEFFRIQVYVVPVGVLMGFKARHEEFPLYMEMTAAQAARNKINWMLDGQPVSMDQASAIAKRLFAHLIMVARGEASDSDKFSLNQKPPVAPDSSQPARPKSFGGGTGNKIELLKPEWLLEENPRSPGMRPQSPLPLQPPSGPLPSKPVAPPSGPLPSQPLPQAPLQAPQPFLQQMPQQSQMQQSQSQPLQQRPQQLNQQPQYPQHPQSMQSQSMPSPQQNNPQQQFGQPQGQRQYGQPQSRQSQESQSQTGPQQFFANQQQQQQASGGNPYGGPQGYPAPTISSVNAPSPAQQGQMQNAGQPRSNVQDLLQQNLVLVLNECNQFAGAIDRQLELLTPIGVKSIQDQDMQTASEIMQRAKRLKALLDAVVTFTDEWKNSSK